MAESRAETTIETQEQPDEGGADKIAAILEQTRETLELVRSLVALLLRQQGDRGGPKLEDLIATLVAQQRDILVCVRHVQTDLVGLHHRLDHAIGAAGNGHGRDEAGRA
jgi:hypothetical protein